MVDVTDTEEFPITIHRHGVDPLTYSIEAITPLEAARLGLVRYLDEIKSPSGSSERAIIIIHTAVGRHSALGAPRGRLDHLPVSPVAVTTEDGDDKQVCRVLQYDNGGVKPLVGDRSLSDEHQEMVEGFQFTG